MLPCSVQVRNIYLTIVYLSLSETKKRLLEPVAMANEARTQQQTD